MNFNVYSLEFQRYIRPKNLLFAGANDMQEMLNKEVKTSYFKSFSKAVFIEADPDIFKKLKANVNTFNKKFQKSFIAKNALISNEDDEEYTFHVMSNGGQSSSIYELDTFHLNRFSTREVSQKKLTSKTLSTIIKESGLNNEKFDLELDLQGAELNALKGLDLKYFNQIISIFVEVSFDSYYKNAPLFPKIDEFLTERGFFICPPHGPGFHGDLNGLFRRGVFTGGDSGFYKYKTTTVALDKYFDILPPIEKRNYEEWHLPSHGTVNYLNKNFKNILNL
tara:strand:- start:250 stop:1086 length:837 start_codon:yes stop_codon:yes gene_type:complete